MNKKRFWYRVVFLIGFLILLEGVLRWIGFTEVPCYRMSRVFEYEVIPSQTVHRFGNAYITNSYGMRSPEVDPQTVHVLKFGDSVLNGGVGTDQDELASSLIQRQINQQMDSVQVLNVSAGSWGPDNAYMWMRTYGDFDARVICLLFSSHDWDDHMTFREVVGHTPFYPDHNPRLAIPAAIKWVYSRYFQHIDWDALPVLPGVDPALLQYRSGWQDFVAYTRSKDIPLVVYHHADKQEVLSGKWNAKGVALEKFLKENDVQTVSGLKAGFTESDFRDELHPNAEGQARIAQILGPEIIKTLEKIRHE